jgi:hypothetical protein
VKHLAVFILMLLLFISALSCAGSNDDVYANVNVINYRDFYLSAESVGLTSSIRGTIFIKGDLNKPNVRHAQISAWIEIDPTDWGGVEFYLKEGSGWKVTSVTTDYPQGYPRPEKETVIFTDDWHRSVQIGNQHSYIPWGNNAGGKGSLIMELEPDLTKNDLPEDFTLGISIGSKYDYFRGPVHETFHVPLNVDYRNTSSSTTSTP